MGVVLSVSYDRRAKSPAWRDPTHQAREDERLFARLNRYDIDFSDVRAREFAKRALVVAGAAGHHVLMR
jgi:predicted ATPase with chaperone activity